MTGPNGEGVIPPSPTIEELDDILEWQQRLYEEREKERSQDEDEET